jgi:hypothetical protein
VADAEGLPWLLDPILLDCALQVQLLWARLNWDTTMLPTEIAGHRRLAPIAAADGPVRHELRIRPDTSPPLCRADHWFLSRDGTVLGTLTGVLGAGTPALNRLAAGTA